MVAERFVSRGAASFTLNDDTEKQVFYFFITKINNAGFQFRIRTSKNSQLAYTKRNLQLAYLNP